MVRTFGTPKSRLPKGSHKGRQVAHNQATGKYNKQRFRTANNKAKARKKHLEQNPNDLQAVVQIPIATARDDQAFLK